MVGEPRIDRTVQGEVREREKGEAVERERGREGGREGVREGIREIKSERHGREGEGGSGKES